MKYPVLFLATLFSLAAQPLAAQSPTLVRDFWTGSVGSFLNHGRPLGFRQHGNSLLLFASDGGGINKLYRLDDLSGNVQELAHVGGPAGYTTTNGGIITSGENIYFFAQQPSSLNFLLWCVRPGQAAEQLAVLPYSVLFNYAGLPLPGGGLLFPGHDADHGFEPWVTDGTVGGTHLLKDIAPGTATSLGSPFPLFQGFDFEGKGYFLANDGTNGPQLWVSDGAEAGTQQFAILNEADKTGATALLWSRNDDRFIVTTHAGLLASDGTTAGTSIINGSDFAMAHIPGLNYPLAGADGYMYFSALEDSDWKLYRTRGTTASTELLLEDVVPNQGFPYLTELNGALYVLAGDGDQNTVLARIDPTTQQLTIVKTFLSAQGSNGLSNFYGFRNDGARFYFMGREGAHARQYWKSDGTEAGTAMVHEFLPQPINGGPDAVDGNMTVFQNTFVFSANGEDVGIELWAGPGAVGIGDAASSAGAVDAWCDGPGRLQVQSLQGPIRSIRVLDAAGRTVLQQGATGDRVEVALQRPAGAYLVQVTTALGVSTVRVFLY